MPTSMAVRVTGYALIAATSLSFVLAIVGAIFPGIGENIFNQKVILPFWAAITTALIVYLVPTFEEVARNLADLSEKTLPHLEIFQAATDFQARMAQLNSAAISIRATNFSYAPDEKKEGPVADYYEALHKTIKKRDGRLRSFRVIASVGDSNKARWLLSRANTFAGNGKFSMAITLLEHAMPLQCIHIIETEKESYVFFFPQVPRHEDMRSFLIEDKRLASLLGAQFDQAWEKSLPVVDGGALQNKGVEELKKRADNRQTMTLT
jgi:hypothetical protein